MSLSVIVGTILNPHASANGAVLNRFHISAVAFQRAQQLKLGARPRVDAGTHKIATVAVMEVLADTISWNTI